MGVIAYSKIGREFVFKEYSPRYPREPDYKIVHYKLEVSIDFKNKSIDGKATLQVVKHGESVRHVDLDAVSLNIKRVYDGRGLLRFDYDGETLRIYLRRKLSNRPTEVTIEYSVREPEHGLYFIDGDEDASPMVWSQGEAEWHRYWMPIYDYPNMKFTSEMIIRVEKGYKAFANGYLVSHWTEGNSEVWHYRINKPHSSYLIALAVGKFSVSIDEVDGVRLEYVVPEGMEEYIESTFRYTPDMIRFFSEWLGVKYPYKVYRQVVVRRFIVGGMENITTTLLTDRSLMDDFARRDDDPDGLISHELSHQWFGDLITCKDWSHIWLNESFATFMHTLYYGHLRGRDEFIYQLYRNLQSYLNEYSSYYSRPIVIRLYKYPEELFDAHSYPKGSVILNMLMNIVGVDTFRKALKEFLTMYAFDNVETDDLRKVLERYYGKPLEWFFEQYLYNSGHPVLSVKTSYNEKDKMLTIELNQLQDTDAPEVYRLPLEVIIEQGSGKTIRTRIFMDKRTRVLTIPMSKRPRYVYIDPEFKTFMVLKINYPLEDRIRILRNSKYVYWRILAARSLCKESSSKAVDALAEAVEKDSFYGVSIEAARSLGDIKTDYAKSKLLELLDKVSNPKVKREVILSLGKYNDESIAPRLIKILEDREEAYTVRAAAARSIGKVGYKKTLEVLKKYISVPSHDYKITKGVLEGIAETGSDEAFKIILEYTTPDKQESLRALAVTLLGKFPHKRDTYKHLKELAYDKEAKVRRAVVLAARELMDPRALPILEVIISREKMGWTWKAARLVAKKIRENIEKGVEWQKLREEIAKLQEEARRLGERVEKIESKG